MIICCYSFSSYPSFASFFSSGLSSSSLTRSALRIYLIHVSYTSFFVVVSSLFMDAHHTFLLYVNIIIPLYHTSLQYIKSMYTGRSLSLLFYIYFCVIYIGLYICIYISLSLLCTLLSRGDFPYLLGL